MQFALLWLIVNQFSRPLLPSFSPAMIRSPVVNSPADIYTPLRRRRITILRRRKSLLVPVDHACLFHLPFLPIQ
ncbi:hypothetical protein L1987_26723 [Smallanthus sonchifolius]|uniref:Uncharacterized protein n=1 Tax=Smallanthus sonchifolius TaxID=185202 RepID=A0ACB9ICR1_9ASTR|nr:hypothetical protein L1987_26723 [Smallanthus sonchifolius]